MASRLREATLDERLGDWTTALTEAVVSTCRGMGWRASAKGHATNVLPVRRSEYLGLDVVAFQDGHAGWRFPLGIMELENKVDDDSIGYSLWKLMCVRADLRIVFCYRRTSGQRAALVRSLREEVVGALDGEGRVRLGGETLVVMGCRDDASTFPYGFFKWWELETNTGGFAQVW